MQIRLGSRTGKLLVLGLVRTQGGETESTYVVVDPALFLDHTVAHIESVEEDTSRCQCQLWQLEQDSGLYDEVDSLCPADLLFRNGEPICD